MLQLKSSYFAAYQQLYAVIPHAGYTDLNFEDTVSRLSWIGAELQASNSYYSEISDRAPQRYMMRRDGSGMYNGFVPGAHAFCIDSGGAIVDMFELIIGIDGINVEIPLDASP